MTVRTSFRDSTRTGVPYERMSTPWGAAQDVEPVADGVWFVGTAGHGGYKLDRKANALIPDYLRRPGGWYEEDCEWSIVEVVFSLEDSPRGEVFRSAKNASRLLNAHHSMVSWYPDEYEKLLGVSILPGASTVREEKLFREAHGDDMVTVAAWGSWHEKVPAGFVGVYAVKGGRNENGHYASNVDGHFLVPEAEYDARDHHGFIVDPARHEKVEAF